MDPAQLEQFMAKMSVIESTINAFSQKADAEIKDIGKVSRDTQTAIENLGLKQHKLAEEAMQLKQHQE